MFNRKIVRKFFSDPSLEMMQASLSKGLNRLVVTQVLSDEMVRIPSVDGLGIGSQLFIGPKQLPGIVVHFDKTFATVACPHAVAIGQEVVPQGSYFKFSIPSVSFSACSPSVASDQILTGISEIDWLMNVQEGTSVGIYGQCPDRWELSFPSKKFSTAIDMYLDLISVANEAMATAKSKPVVLRLNFRGMESVFESLQFQAGHPLPISPNALVSSILQLSHKPAPNGSFGVSIIAVFDDPTSFGGEATQSVDMGVSLDGAGRVANLDTLVCKQKSDSTVKGALLNRICTGYEKKRDFHQQEQMGIYVDYWDKEEIDSFNTMIKILPFAAKLTDPRDSMIAMRALTILHFKKTGKLDRLDIEQFIPKIIPMVSAESIDQIDSTLLSLRFNFDITSH